MAIVKATRDGAYLRLTEDLKTKSGAILTNIGALESGFTLEGGTYDPVTTITTQTSSAAALTIPDLAGVAQQWVFTKKAATLENKTISGNSNTLSDINAGEVETSALTIGTYGLPFVIVVPNAGSATNVIFNANCPYKLRIIDAWAVATKSCSGTWKLDNGTNDITTTVSYGTDKAVSRASTIDDAYYGLAANATLRLISSDSGDTAVVYVTAIRQS